MALLKCERETIIVFNEEDKLATVETFNISMRKKLSRLSKEYPDDFRCIKEDENIGCSKYEIPKRYIRIGSPRSVSDEQREVMSKRAKEYWKNKGNEEDE